MYFYYILWGRTCGIKWFPEFRHQISAVVRSRVLGLSHPQITPSREETRWRARQGDRGCTTSEANRVHARTLPVGWARPCEGGLSGLRELTSVTNSWRAGSPASGSQTESEKLESAVSYRDNQPWVLCLLRGPGPGKQHLVASLDGKIHEGSMLPVLLCDMYPST